MLAASKAIVLLKSSQTKFIGGVSPEIIGSHNTNKAHLIQHDVEMTSGTLQTSANSVFNRIIAPNLVREAGI